MSSRPGDHHDADRLRHGAALVEAIEAHMHRRIIDAVAQIVGREEAERLAADVYRKGPPAQRLSPGEPAALADAEPDFEVPPGEPSIAERQRRANAYLAEINAIRLLCGTVAVRDGLLIDTRIGGVLAYLARAPETPAP